MRSRLRVRRVTSYGVRTTHSRQTDLLRCIEICGEADGAALRHGCVRVHQFTDRREDGADSAIVLGEASSDSQPVPSIPAERSNSGDRFLLPEVCLIGSRATDDRRGDGAPDDIYARVELINAVCESYSGALGGERRIPRRSHRCDSYHEKSAIRALTPEVDGSI
jgi:hypothetical protein